MKDKTNNKVKLLYLVVSVIAVVCFVIGLKFSNQNSKKFEEAHSLKIVSIEAIPSNKNFDYKIKVLKPDNKVETIDRVFKDTPTDTYIQVGEKPSTLTYNEDFSKCRMYINQYGMKGVYEQIFSK